MGEAGKFFIMSVVGVALAYVYICSLGGFKTVAASQPSPSQGGDSVVGSVSISASKIDSILSAAGSPARGLGNVFTLDSAEYNIDDAVALAFFHHESTYGLYGVASQTHSLGNIKCSDGYICIDGFRAYPSWQAGIDDWYRLMASPAYVGGGLTTLNQIIPKYAPSSDGNSESNYIAAVRSDVQSWRS
jgi:hypothetical protein